MATTVIIPARNEEVAIGEIVKTFSEHPETCNSIFVGIDKATIDTTPLRVRENGGYPVKTLVHGKGQVVQQTLLAVSNMPGMLSRRVILCDGDYTGLTGEHIDAILSRPTGMVVGVPDFPEHVPTSVINAWPRVSGFRCLPWAIIPSDAHGYLLETQLNLRCIRIRLPIKQIMMEGLKSPFQWPLSPQRDAARKADHEWGLSHGVFYPTTA